jgi:putative membrane protein
MGRKDRTLWCAQNMMLAAMVLSILFLVSYIAHHLLAGETSFGGEGAMRTLYYVV